DRDDALVDFVWNESLTVHELLESLRTLCGQEDCTEVVRVVQPPERLARRRYAIVLVLDPIVVVLLLFLGGSTDICGIESEPIVAELAIRQHAKALVVDADARRSASPLALRYRQLETTNANKDPRLKLELDVGKGMRLGEGVSLGVRLFLPSLQGWG